MDPNNPNPQEGNENLQKLEQDLQKLSQEASVQAPQPSQTPVPPVAPVTPSAPPVQPPAPTPEVKKSSPLLTVAIASVAVAAVALAAYLIGTKFLGQKATPTPTATPTIISSPTSTPDITANWKIYTNVDLKFSFKYPAGWSSKPYEITTTYPLHGLVEVAPADLDKSIPGGTVVVSYWENPQKLSLQQIEEKYKGEAGGPNLYFPSGAFTKIGNLDAYLGKGVGCEPLMCDRVAIILDSSVVEIKSLYGQSNLNKEIFDQILSTFKFLEASATPSASPQ